MRNSPPAASGLTLTVEVGELPALPEHDGEGVAAGLLVFLW